MINKAIDESYSLFTDIMNMEPLKRTKGHEKREELATENVMEEIRKIIGISDLFEIRSFIIKRSVEFARRDA